MGGWGVILVSRPRALCLDRCGGEISDQPVASVVRVGTGVGRFPAQRHGARDAGNGRGVLGGIIGTGDTRLAFSAPGRSRAEERLGGQGDWGGVPRRHVWSTPRLVPPPFALSLALFLSRALSLALSLSLSRSISLNLSAIPGSMDVLVRRPSAAGSAGEAKSLEVPAAGWAVEVYGATRFLGSDRTLSGSTQLKRKQLGQLCCTLSQRPMSVPTRPSPARQCIGSRAGAILGSKVHSAREQNREAVPNHTHLQGYLAHKKHPPP